MGYYLETPGHLFGKADRLASEHGGVVLTYCGGGVPRDPWSGSLLQKAIRKLMQNFDIVVVVRNMQFEAAAYAFDEGELDAFMADDDPRKRWLLMFPKGVAAKLSGYINEAVA